MKKLLIGLLTAGLVFCANAVDQTYPIFNKTGIITNLISGSAQITGIYLYNGHDANITYALYDAPASNLTSMTITNGGVSYLQGAYTSYITFTTNWTAMVTNFYGGTNTVTYTNVIMTVPSTISAAFKNFRLIAMGVIAPSNTVTIDLPQTVYTGYGLVYTNSHATNGTSVRLIYSQP